MELVNKLQYYFSFPFVQYAFIVGILIALCASLVGVTLVLKRLSFIGDGLSHVAFGAVTIATVLHISNQLWLVTIVTIIAAILLLNPGKHFKIKGDAAVAMLSVGSLAVGYLLLSIFSTSANLAGDVCTTLFGSTLILTLSIEEVYLCIVMACIVLVIFIFFYHKIFAVTFDSSFAQATGINTNHYNLLLAIVIALIIVLAMNLVGSLLISALVIFPALSSMRLFKNFKSVMISSAFLGVLCAIIGLTIAILAGTPVGSTIVTVQIIVFILCSIVGSALGG